MTVDAANYFRCQDLIHRLFDALDHRRLDEVMSYLTADAGWQRERWYEGTVAIRGALDARPADLNIRHVLTNLIVDAAGTSFKTRLMMIPQLAMAKDGMGPPFRADPIAMLAELNVTIVAVGETLKVSEITFESIFRPDLA